MSDHQYSQEELDRMRMFERAMWLRDIEVGKPVTEKQFEAIRHFLGGLIDQAKAVKMETTSIHFKNGRAYSINNNGLIDSVNGEKLIEPSAERKE